MGSKLDDSEPAIREGMDGVRILTLAMVCVHTISVVVLSLFLVTNVQEQRSQNECYQRQITSLTEWANGVVLGYYSDQQANRELFFAMSTPGDDQAAFERHLARLNDANQARAISPVPLQVCN